MKSRRTIKKLELVSDYGISPECYPNRPADAGKLAHHKLLFGEANRYAIAPVHTRFDAVQWFVWDAETPDLDGNPTIIRQNNKFEDAIAGLNQ